MKQLALFTTIVAISIYAFFASGVFTSLALFLTVGMVPGTDYMVSPEYLAGIYTAIVALLLARAIVLIAKRLFTLFRPTPTPKKPLARRRYSRTPIA